jgi:hypothetical protein
MTVSTAHLTERPREFIEQLEKPMLGVMQEAAKAGMRQSHFASLLDGLAKDELSLPGRVELLMRQLPLFDNLLLISEEPWGQINEKAAGARIYSNSYSWKDLEALKQDPPIDLWTLETGRLSTQWNNFTLRARYKILDGEVVIVRPDGLLATFSGAYKGEPCEAVFSIGQDYFSVSVKIASTQQQARISVQTQQRTNSDLKV